jgi:hypothetical protein
MPSSPSPRIAESRVCRPHHSTQDQPASTTLYGALPPVSTQTASVELRVDGMDLSIMEAVLDGLDIDTSVPAVPQFFKGGPGEAKKRLRRFIAQP